MRNHLRAVLVGCGEMSREWLRFLPEVEGIELVGLVDIREDSAKARAEEFQIADAVIGSDLKTVLGITRPDIVFDITVPEAHVDVTLEALSFGCHVLGEKPMADSMDNARRMVEAAQKADRIYAVIQNRRYDARIRRLKEYLATGVAGLISTVNSDFYIGAHFGGFRDRMKHVLLLDMAIHTFDAARFLIQADPVSVFCRDWNPEGSWYDHGASAVALFEMSNGVVYTYRGSWCCEGLNTTWESDWRIQCANGCIAWDGGDVFRGQKVMAAGGFHSELESLALPDHLQPDKQGGHAGVVREFIDCIHTGKAPETICTDNIRSLAMVFSAIESSETRRWIEVRI